MNETAQRCVTHHHGCDCREARVVDVIRAAERLCEYADHRGYAEIVGPGIFAWTQFLEGLRQAVKEFRGNAAAVHRKEGK